MTLGELCASGRTDSASPPASSSSLLLLSRPGIPAPRVVIVFTIHSIPTPKNTPKASQSSAVQLRLGDHEDVLIILFELVFSFFFIFPLPRGGKDGAEWKHDFAF